MLTINRTRFLNTLNTMAGFGLLPDSAGGGRDRRPFSPAERDARRYFTKQAETAGLTVTTDAAANLSARLACWTGQCKNAAPGLASGHGAQRRSLRRCAGRDLGVGGVARGGGEGAFAALRSGGHRLHRRGRALRRFLRQPFPGRQPHRPKRWIRSSPGPKPIPDDLAAMSDWSPAA